MEKQVEDLRRRRGNGALRAVGERAPATTKPPWARRWRCKSARASSSAERQAPRCLKLERDVKPTATSINHSSSAPRETEEQETLNTSSARIGEATVPQRRTSPPAMSLLAMIGLVLGALAACLDCRSRPLPVDQKRTETGWFGEEDSCDAINSETQSGHRRRPSKSRRSHRLESDVIRTLGGILDNGPDAGHNAPRLATLRAGFPLMGFLGAVGSARPRRGIRLPMWRR